MGAKDSCKPLYEVLVDAVHEKKGSLVADPMNIFLMDFPQHTNLGEAESVVHLEKVTKKKRIDPLKAELANSGEEDFFFFSL